MPLRGDAEVKPFEECGGTSILLVEPLSKGFGNATGQIQSSRLGWKKLWWVCQFVFSNE